MARWCSGQGVGLVIASSTQSRCSGGQPRSTQPSIPLEQVKRVTAYWLGLRQGTFTCVWWQVMLYDPIWQVTPVALIMGFPLRAIHTLTYKNLLLQFKSVFSRDPVQLGSTAGKQTSERNMDNVSRHCACVCRQCAKEALKDLCRWLHHGGEVAVCLSLFLMSANVSG